MASKKAKAPRFSSRWDWEDFIGLEDLPVADLDLIRRTLRNLQTFNVVNPLRYFFATVLQPHYDRVVYSGLNREAAFVIYRLSDQVPANVRASIEIYPNGDQPWYTLEDWRFSLLLSCKNGEGDIPFYLGELPHIPEI